MISTDKKIKKSYKGIMIGIGIVAVFLGIGVTSFLNAEKITYDSATVSKETIETYYTFSGNVESENIQNVMAESILQISEIKVKEGDSVSKDDVLFVASDGTEITAKINGTMDRILVEEGEQVMSGTLLSEIIDLEHLQLGIKVDEYDLDCVALDNEIEINISALDKDVVGTISHISRTAINQNGVAYFAVTASLETDHKVKPGMSAETKILKEKSQDVLSIPMSALSFEEDNTPFVYISDGRNKKSKVYVTVGINDGKNVEIKEGLKNGQIVYYEELSKNSSDSFLPMPGAM